MKRSYFLLRNQVENLGDWVLNRNLIELFINDDSIVVINDQIIDQTYKAFLQVKKVQFHSSNPFLHLLFHRYEFLLLSPGHPTYKKDFVSIVKMLLKLIVFWVLKLKGVKIVFIGAYVSEDEFNGLNGFLLKKYINLHHTYALRDNVLVKKLYLKSDKIEYCPDIFLKGYIEEKSFSVQKIKKIAVSLRFDGPEISDEILYKNKLIEKLFEILYDLDDLVEIDFVYQVGRDKNPNRELYKKIKNSNRFKDRVTINFNENMLNVPMAEEIYSSADIVISNRLHCTLFSLICGTIPVPLSDMNQHKKLYGAFKDLSLDYLCYDIDSSEGINDFFKHNRDNFSRINSTLNDKKESINKFIKSNMK